MSEDRCLNGKKKTEYSKSKKPKRDRDLYFYKRFQNLFKTTIRTQGIYLEMGFRQYMSKV